MILPKFKDSDERSKFLQWRLRVVAILAVIIFGFMVYQSFHEKGLSSQEKQLAIEDYSNDPHRLSKIEEWHEECFQIGYKRKTRTKPEQFDRERYRRCLDISPEEWLRERREIRLQEEREKRELRNP